MPRILPLLLAGAISAPLLNAATVAHFPFDLNGSRITESVSGRSFEVAGRFAPQNAPGAVGKALRLDGYSTTLDIPLGDILVNPKASSVSFWIALEAYPIIENDIPTTEKACIIDALDRSKRTGFSFQVSKTGDWGFTSFPGGWEFTLDAEKKIPRGQWAHLAAVMDPETSTLSLYLNGEQVASRRCNAPFAIAGPTMKIGHSDADRFMGPFRLTSFSGLIDDLRIFDEALPPATLAGIKPENKADFAMDPSRYAGAPTRPKFHGMPSANWTNESHGLIYSGGRYHIFFQKNPNGPYMSRLHWGHISSPDLLNWHEDPVAFAPDADYDIKGCWSGAVFQDAAITGNLPAAIYTAVDYGRAVIAQARPQDDLLLEWTKPSDAILINGRPNGLSDDFRDPYFFRNGDKAYIIVGTSKDGIGACTLHEYNPSSKTWSNDGRIFYKGSSAQQDGTFWEMPNLTPMGNGKWLFTATPLGISNGVRAVYRVGTLNAVGQFIPDAAFSSPKNIELINGDGYGLLSPSIMQHDGKTIALGIVPDKLSGEANAELGWAHTYSLPREWSLGADGELLQKPYSGLESLRSAKNTFSQQNVSLNGELSLEGVNGAHIELDATFIASSAPFGFRFFKTADGEAEVRVNPVNGEVRIDLTRLARISNDAGGFNGVYTAGLPQRIKAGEEVRVRLFVDGSIADLFINDRYATSFRVFPRATSGDGFSASVFSNGAVTVKNAQGWMLEASTSGIAVVAPDDIAVSTAPLYRLDGTMVLADATSVQVAEILPSLPDGIYLHAGRKYIRK